MTPGFYIGTLEGWTHRSKDGRANREARRCGRDEELGHSKFEMLSGHSWIWDSDAQVRGAQDRGTHGSLYGRDVISESRDWKRSHGGRGGAGGGGRKGGQGEEGYQRRSRQCSTRETGVWPAGRGSALPSAAGRNV